MSSPVVTPAPVAPPKPLPWWVAFAINSGMVAIRQALHNPQQAANLKESMLDLRNAINATYADDPDFK